MTFRYLSKRDNEDVKQKSRNFFLSFFFFVEESVRFLGTERRELAEENGEGKRLEVARETFLTFYRKTFRYFPEGSRGTRGSMTPIR